jgi:thiamine-monophosphate kinase
MNEADFIASLRAIATGGEARGLMDDTAVLGDLVLTHDMMVAGTHFPEDADPGDVAWKLVAVNLSDLAAKGAAPLGVLLGYMLGDDAWDIGFVAGLRDALAHYDAALWGGDTVAAPRAGALRAIGLTAIGRAAHTPPPARNGARPGDALWVTGAIGDALLGFRLDRAGAAAPVAPLARFRRPVPRIAEGIALAPQAHAMMDVSDGLLLDARRMADASGVTIAIEAAAVPRSADLTAAIARAPDLAAAALRWGDDYELLAALPAGIVPAVPATRIGRVLARGDHGLLVDGAPPQNDTALGWEHRPPA